MITPSPGHIVKAPSFEDRNSMDAAHPAYLERVYAGVLGKLIGVYLGRPVENWSYEKIGSELGSIDYYIHEERGRRLIVTDDDISGTFTFLRALEDYNYSPNLTSEQIGHTWLNYLIEKTTILWWGGMGNSTEHTAYLRLKHGIPAPRSGSMELNSQIVAEQIGSQIFIEGWGLICPGDPVKAVDFAAKAAHVSHDGEAVYGAQVVAAMVAEAFVESRVEFLLEKAKSLIPTESTVHRLIQDLQNWHSVEPDWRANRERLEADYGYDKYCGQCHLIPNHGLIILSLLHGDGDFDKSMMIVNTSGWDTDCNSGNVGTILGVKNGLDAFTKQDWRGPVADRLFLPSADGGRAITDAVRETLAVANGGRRLAGLPALAPKDGARFHFTLRGSVQGWMASDPSSLEVRNTNELDGALALTMLDADSAPARASTPTFIPPDAKDMQTGYVLVASPTLYPGQTVQACLRTQDKAASGKLFLSHYTGEDSSVSIDGPAFSMEAGEERVLSWKIEAKGGQPIHEIGIELEQGAVELVWLDWKGVPTCEFAPAEGTMWSRAWAKAIDRFAFARDKYEYLSQNEGIGLLIQGCREWSDYRIEARITPRMAVSGGIALRVQGLRRYYSLLFTSPGEVRLEKMLDGRKILAHTAFPWEPFQDYDVEIEVRGNEIRAWIDGKLKLSAVDVDSPLLEGAFGFVVEAGCMGAGTPKISPA